MIISLFQGSIDEIFPYAYFGNRFANEIRPFSKGMNLLSGAKVIKYQNGLYLRSTGLYCYYVLLVDVGLILLRCTSMDGWSWYDKVEMPFLQIRRMFA